MVDKQAPSLQAQAEQIARDFDINSARIRRVTRHFVSQMKDGLVNPRIWQLPSYVKRIPTGTETGEFLAVDLGGSNCRICLVKLQGDSTFNVARSKHSVPPDVMINASYRPLFDFIAEKIAEFLRDQTGPYSLGFTFSFTCEQTSLAGGRLLRWDKGWDIPEALGRDPCAMLQEAIDRKGLPVRVTVLANDSVGTLLTRSYTSGPAISPLAAIIFGTGTNAAYVEKLRHVQRLGATANSDGIMVINTEWGCLDDAMEVLPRTAFDDELDTASTDPGSQMLEKRVSGLYLGELLRLTIRRLDQMGNLDMTIDEKSPCSRRDGIDSSFLSELAEPRNINNTISLIEHTLSAENVSESDAQAIQLIAMSIARRAARLAGASLAALVIQSDRLEPSPRWSKHTGRAGRFWHRLGFLWQRVSCPIWMGRLATTPASVPFQTHKEDAIIDIAADGSLIEFYPTFEAEMRVAMREVPEVGPGGEQRIRIRLAKDGSGVGAALMAQAAGETEKASHSP
ncbi:hypothetical protein BJX76DRAFT_350409 [Aspergillus varians]